MASTLYKRNDAVDTVLGLAEWRNLPLGGERLQTQWDIHRDALQTVGVELFQRGHFPQERRPNQPRAVEELHMPRLCFVGEEEVIEGKGWRETDTRVVLKSALCHPASTKERWVMVRVVKVQHDGRDHLDILRFIQRSTELSKRCLPMLQEICCPSATFAVFQYCLPLGRFEPDFDTMDEALQFSIQATAAYASLHNAGICQRDPALNNFVIKMAGPCQSTEDYVSGRGANWRTAVKAEYYVIDFEYAKQWFLPTAFEANNLPGAGWIRPCAPEMLSGLPYNAALAEGFNLGLVFWELFKQIANDQLQDIYESLLVLEPEQRCTVAEAHLALLCFRDSMSGEDLAQCIPPQQWQEGQCHRNARFNTKSAVYP